LHGNTDPKKKGSVNRHCVFAAVNASFAGAAGKEITFFPYRLMSPDGTHELGSVYVSVLQNQI
jgi:hypothetical protein